MASRGAVPYLPFPCGGSSFPVVPPVGVGAEYNVCASPGSLPACQSGDGTPLGSLPAKEGGLAAGGGRLLRLEQPQPGVRLPLGRVGRSLVFAAAVSVHPVSSLPVQPRNWMSFQRLRVPAV